MTPTEKNPLPPCLIFINKEGRWYHKGTEMVHRGFIRLFYQNMELDSEGRYVIHWKGERCQVEVEDTAFVVWGVSYREQEGAGDPLYVLSLSDDTEEELMPETLFIGKANVLYCRVKNRTFPARFRRVAYYQLAAYVEEDEGRFYLPAGAEKFEIRENTIKDL